MARLKQDLRDPLARTRLLDRIGEDRILPTLPIAVEGYHDCESARRLKATPSDRSVTGASSDTGSVTGPQVTLVPNARSGRHSEWIRTRAGFT